MYRYSRRLSWDFFSNSLSAEVARKRRRSEAILDLTQSNPTEVLDPYPHSAIAEAFAEIRSFRYEPDPCGSEAARVTIRGYYAARGISFVPKNILLTASTSEAYALVFKLLCDPGDEVLVPAPSYPLFEYLARLESVRVTHYFLRFDGAWFIDFESLRERITGRTRAIVIVNPNNPTGSHLKKNEWDTLSQIALERGLPVISDEVFLHYPLAADPARVETLIGRDSVLSFSLNGLSKAAGMPQMKLGWIVINGPEEDCARARERLELIADTYLSVNTPVQRALPKLLDIGSGIQRAILERTRINWTVLQAILRDSGAQALACEGGWSAIVRLPATASEESWVLRILDECGILVQPGYFFDMATEPYIVVSLISAPGDFESGISRISRLASRQ